MTISFFCLFQIKIFIYSIDQVIINMDNTVYLFSIFIYANMENTIYFFILSHSLTLNHNVNDLITKSALIACKPYNVPMKIVRVETERENLASFLSVS